jgi:aminopeptidase YwaD
LLNVRDAYSGERARDVVGFVEQYWRIPGNTGFDASIQRVVDALEEAGYASEGTAGPEARLTYRVERRPMGRPTWEPIGASLTIVGRDDPLLELATNRSMITAYSYSTPPEGIEAEVVDVGAGRPEDFARIDVGGKIVFGETNTRRLFREAVQRRGAVGVISYGLPAYNQPERHQNSISFGSIPLDSTARSFGLRLSYAARETLKSAMAAGPVRIRAMTETRIYRSDELTLVADVRGDTHADKRFVFSAHVQEPGANDNASGVGALSEIARVFAEEYRAGRFDPARTITMIWGDEISSTRRYLEEDSARTAGVRWGLSLDMVGEDTEKTGGTFLIEKMPDPSSVWTRGNDQHTEWGGRPLTVDQLAPHYLNDFILNRCLDQAAGTGWVVKTNPYEGGSDHVPFLRAGKPGVLLWHFTDVFYHTDRDRLEMVSAETLKNVGVCAAVSAMTLASADGATARFVIEELERSAVARLETEAALSREAVGSGEAVEEQRTILRTWTEWYESAIGAAEDIEVGGASSETAAALQGAVGRVRQLGDSLSLTIEG